MAGSVESIHSSKTKVVVTNEGGDSVSAEKPSPTEEQKDPKSQTSTTPASTTSGYRRRIRRVVSGKSKGAFTSKRSLPVPRRGTVNSSSSSESLAEQAARFTDPPLSSSPDSADASRVNAPANGPTFAQIATRPIRIASKIMSKITVELTGQEFYLVQDDHGKPFLLEKDIIESKYSHLLPLYRASIRGKRDSWMCGKFI